MNKRQRLVQQAFLNNEEEVISRLQAIYGESLAGITKKVKVLDSSIAQLQKALGDITEDEIGGLALAVLKKKNLTPAEAQETIRSMIQAKVYQKQYQEALKKQVGGVLDKMGEKQYTTVSDYLTGCYQDGFIGTMYDLQGQGIPLCMPIDQQSMVRAVQLDSKISKGLYTRLGEDVTALKRKITAQISRGVASGLTYREMAQQLAGETRIGFNNAVRIARTEGHRIQCQAGMDACEKAREKGCDVLKQWDATLDGNTRESHSQVDGEIRELDKPFSNGLMFPGDPSGGAAEVINCRCALLQRASWELDEEELEELKKRAEFFGLDKSASFEEYKQKYLKAAESQVEDVTSGFVPATTIEEAEDFISRYVDPDIWGATGIDYSGLTVDAANAINKTLYELYETYDFDPLGGVYVPKGNSKLGKAIDGAHAAYAPVRQSLLINKNSLKKVDIIGKEHAKEIALIQSYAKDPTSLTFRTKRAEMVTRASVLSGRATVPDTIEDVIHHEMGHALEKKVKGASNWSAVKGNMSKYAERISGYATYDESEYIAESFASYLKGEKLIDPELQAIFDSLKKKSGSSIAIFGKSGIIDTEIEQLALFNSKSIKTIILPKQEYAHIMSEFATNMSKEQRQQPIVSKAIGDYIYTIENNGFGNYRVIGKVPIGDGRKR